MGFKFKKSIIVISDPLNVEVNISELKILYNIHQQHHDFYIL